MTILFPLLMVLSLMVAANLVAVSSAPSAKRAYTWALVLLNVPLLVFGIAVMMVPDESLPLLQDAGLPVSSLSALGWVFSAMAIWAILCCLDSFRRFLARLLPIDPESPVHLTALVLAGYLVGNTALALTQDVLGQLDSIELAVSLAEVLAQQVAFIILAYAGAGLFVRRDLGAVNERLGLVRPTWGQLGIGMAVIVMLILIQGTIGAIWAFYDPEQAAELGGINEALLAGFDTVGEWFLLAVAAGFGEELLFRGALQPVFGLPLTSLLFAVVHIQYGLTPITAVVFLLGLILGVVRRYTNTSVAIFVHFGYNFALGLLSLLAVYLQRFVTP